MRTVKAPPAGPRPGAEGLRSATRQQHSLFGSVCFLLIEVLLDGKPTERRGGLTSASGGAPCHTRSPRRTRTERHRHPVEQRQGIRCLYLAGADLGNPCRRLGIGARTVYRYKDLTEPTPRPAYERKGSVLDPYAPYPVARWIEGRRSGKRLRREIREGGYANSEEICDALPPSSGARRQAAGRTRPCPGEEGFIGEAVSHL